MVLVLTWGIGCGHVHHMQTDTQTHLCLCNYVKPRENAKLTDNLCGKLHTLMCSE